MHTGWKIPGLRYILRGIYTENHAKKKKMVSLVCPTIFGLRSPVTIQKPFHSDEKEVCKTS